MFQGFHVQNDTQGEQVTLKTGICSCNLKCAFSCTKYCLKQNLLNQQDLVLSNLEKTFTNMMDTKKLLKVSYKD